MTVHINSQFDSGNIEVINTKSNPIELAIRCDHQSDFYQWFHFSMTGAKDKDDLKLSLVNAAGAAFAEGWEYFQVVASYDREEWFRVPTHYQDGCLIFNHAPEYDIVWYSFLLLTLGKGIKTLLVGHNLVMFVQLQPWVTP